MWKLFEQPPFTYISQLDYISINVHLYRQVLSIETGHRNLNTENLHSLGVVRGCFCDGATWRAEGDHNVDFSLEMRESNPKFNRGPKVQPKG